MAGLPWDAWPSWPLVAKLVLMFAGGSFIFYEASMLCFWFRSVSNLGRGRPL